MTAVREGETLTLSGPPRNATATLPLEGDGAQVVRVGVKLSGGPAVLRAYVRPYGAGSGELRVKLPADTAPGEYRGEVVIGERTRPITVWVTPEPSVRVDPSQTTVRGAPGETVTFEIRLTNLGNVGFDVAKEAQVELDDDRGQLFAFGRTLRAELKDGEHRVDRLFEELRDSHGGQGRVRVVEGAGPLKPGEGRTLRCAFDVPDLARPGRSYTGDWEPAGAGHLIVLEVVEGSPDEPRLRAGRKP
jgi:hypothetical protein